MHHYKLLDGSEGAADRFMTLPKIPKDHHWHNDGQTWIEKPFPLESIDINKRTLFGYDESIFLAKQYR